MQIIPPSPTTPLGSPPFGLFPPLLLLLYQLKSPLSYYIVLYVQISRKLRPCLDSLLLRLARAAGPPFAPGNVFTLKGLAPRQSEDYGVQVFYDELEFSVTRCDMYGTHVRGRSQKFIEC